MRRYIYLMIALLAFVSKAHSEDLLQIADVNISKGQTATIDFVLKNPDNQYTAIQADLYLPNGIEIEKNDGSFVYELNRTANSHSLSIGAMSGFYRLILSSSKNEEISGSDGKVISLSLKASVNIENGSLTSSLKKIKLVKNDGTGKVIDEVPFNVSVQEMIIVTAKSYTRVYGDANPMFEYTTSTTLTGTPEISCDATTTSPVGTYDIIIKKGNVTNNNVTYVKGTLTITKAPLTIKAGTYTKKQGEDNPAFTLTYEGFKNNETEAVLTKKPTVTCDATKTSQPGEYVVKVSGAEAQNYDISYVNGVLKVTNADAVIVTAKSYTRAYGEANPTFEFTSTGAVLEGNPEIICEATATSPVGIYPIVIKKGGVANYNDTYVNGTLTITKAPLSVKAGTYTRKVGEENPEFILTYSGFKNNETEAVLTTKPTATCTVTASSEPGEYEVTVSGGEAQNYELSYTKGKLIVTEADPVVVTANSYTREYGEANPTFEYTSQGASLTGIPDITCDATANSPVGTYPIVVKKGGVTNYNDTYVNGTLTITKAPLIVKVENVSREQYLDNPDFVITYTGWKLNENESVLANKPTATTTATKDSPVGEYVILVSGGEANNYELSYQNGVLTVTQSTDISEIFIKHPVDIYTLQGQRFRIKTTTLEGLPKGTYIIEGRKVFINR